MIKRTNGKQMAQQQYQLLLGALDQWRLQTAPGAHVPPNRGWAPVLFTHCRQLLIIRKISKFDATGCRKCRKFDFRWGSAPDPAWEAYSASTDPLAVFKGPTSKGREGE